MTADVEYGYRVAWGRESFEDFDTWEEALAWCSALERTGGHKENVVRPRIHPVRDGEAKPDIIWPQSHVAGWKH